MVIPMFFALRCSDVIVYFASPPGDKSVLLASIIICSLWTTAAFAGVWCRQGWCRFALQFLVVITTLDFNQAVFSGYYSISRSLPILVVGIGVAVINGVVLWGLIKLADIRKLTSKSYI